MKKKIAVLIGMFALTFGFRANAQAVSEGNFIIDPYYGFPNLAASFIDVSDIEDVNKVGIGPAGLRAEFMLADKFGLGIDLIYNSLNVNGQIDSLNPDGSVYESYDSKIFMRRFRPQVRMNYHFVATNELDVYTGVGVGLNFRQLGVTTDYPNYDDASVSGALIPVSMRLALGMRYYFTENIGANLELGIGGPILSTGLSLKF